MESTSCLDCGAQVAEAPLYERYRVCPQCRFHYQLPAAQRIELLVDVGTFKETNPSLVPLDPLSFADNVPYRERLNQAQRVTGLVEAVITGTGYVGGMPMVMAALDFGFMSGSMGSAVGEKITLAAELALQRRLPFVLVVCGGGHRIQEGVLSLMQMGQDRCRRQAALQEGHCLHLRLDQPQHQPSLCRGRQHGRCHLRRARGADRLRPTPGGQAGHRAAPCPRTSIPPSFHLEHGMIDRIVDRQSLKQQLALLLDLLGFKYRLTLTSRTRLQQVEQPEAPAWDRVQLARHHERPTSRDYIERIISNFVELHGDRFYGDDPAIVTGLGYLSGEAVMVIAQGAWAWGGGDPLPRRPHLPRGLPQGRAGYEAGRQVQAPGHHPDRYAGGLPRT